MKYSKHKEGQWEKDVRNQILDILISKKSRLEKALYSRIYYTKGVASFVSLKPNISNEEFTILAFDLIKDDTVINSMALSKNCIISAIYPLKGHEDAIGLNLLDHPKRKIIVNKTIETRKTFVAGPVELIEGGIAFISYTPIFDKTQSTAGEFWGVTDIVILMDPLLKEAGIVLDDKEMEYSLKGYDGTGNHGEIFFGNKDIFSNNPVTVSINLPYGNWILAAKPKIDWKYYYNKDKITKVYLYLSSLVISILIGLLIYNFLKTKKNETKLKAIFESLDSLIFEFNEKGVYQSVATTKQNLLIKPQHELLGNTIHDIFEKKVANKIQKAITQCLLTRKLVIIEYPVSINNIDCWFQGRISYKSENSVIFNAIDITLIKANEQVIKDSELRLKQSNAMKDKLFSVLAHDLRNSLGSFNQLIDLLVNEYDEFSEEEKRSKLTTINNSSRDVYDLLENILEWQIIKSNAPEVKLKRDNVVKICDEVLVLHSQEAKKKNIKIVNNIPEDTMALYHEKLFSSILRNLVSNAIKFSHRNSTVKIYCDTIVKDDREYLAIKVEDKGIGIQQKKIDRFYSSNLIPSSEGTYNEKGSGLGLVLCKEFVEMQGGELHIESKVTKGSTFIFTLQI
ncbi:MULTISPECIES: sensor histidine kinase [unclassified Saccharicrinis]|uniref:sensor histidine kinase n=1 Tax=unclassified Saccharicrinis TaxID=2646859 RepID=UPI003D342417